MIHCGGWNVPGITDENFKQLTQLERWVEKGILPDSLLMKKHGPDGSVEWTRLIYPYPLQTVYKGEGDVKSASSYESKGH